MPDFGVGADVPEYLWFFLFYFLKYLLYKFDLQNVFKFEAFWYVIQPMQIELYLKECTGNKLLLIKIWGIHGSDYEECHLLEYKTPVHTSQEAHYVSAKKPSLLILCKISGYHDGDYEECRLLWCDAVWLL
jgi:hypothetical protein